MADFCQECSINMFGEDFKELANLITEEEAKQGTVACVLCETCGFIYVDHKGRRINKIPPPLVEEE